MREIKFRIWYSENMENPKMQYCDEICVCDNGLFFEISKFDLFGNHNDTKNPEIMQFTGLKTKNGEEVYEGDVFRSETEKNYGDERIYSVVTWIKERGAFYLIPVDHYQVYMDNDNLEGDPVFEWLFEEANLYDFSIDVGLDLCGNIYENPELISY